MIDINNEETQNAVRMSWNILPANAVDLQRYIIPCGIHYTPLKKVENLQLLEYEPILLIYEPAYRMGLAWFNSVFNILITSSIIIRRYQD